MARPGLPEGPGGPGAPGRARGGRGGLPPAEPGFPAAFAALLDEARDTTARVDGPVAAIIAEVRERGDAALCGFTAQFDQHALTPDRIPSGAD